MHSKPYRNQSKLTVCSVGGLKNEVGSNQRLIRGPFIYDYLLEKNDYLLRNGDVLNYSTAFLRLQNKLVDKLPKSICNFCTV